VALRWHQSGRTPNRLTVSTAKLSLCRQTVTLSILKLRHKAFINLNSVLAVNDYLRQRGYVIVIVCLSVSLFVC